MSEKNNEKPVLRYSPTQYFEDKYKNHLKIEIGGKVYVVSKAVYECVINLLEDSAIDRF